MTAPPPAPAPPPPPPPPWAWTNLTDNQARDLDRRLEEWIGDWNRQLALKMEHLIPACWRQHEALVQELPVQYHGWAYIHRDRHATPLEAIDYYTRSLPSFRDRVGDLLGPTAMKCRVGKHPDPDLTLNEAITRAATDTAARGPDNTDVLRHTGFGT